jgi:acyl carrier protein
MRHLTTAARSTDPDIEREDLIGEIRAMLAECLECPVEDIPDDLSFEDPSIQIDSLSLIRLSAAIDERFDLWVPDGSRPDDPVFRSLPELADWIAMQLDERRAGAVVH